MLAVLVLPSVPVMPMTTNCWLGKPSQAAASQANASAVSGTVR